MKITIITGREHRHQYPRILGAWDDLMMRADPNGLHEEIEHHRKRLPQADIRTAEIEVPDDFIRNIYMPPTVVGNVVNK